jgi:hypothetical protein
MPKGRGGPVDASPPLRGFMRGDLSDPCDQIQGLTAMVSVVRVELQTGGHHEQQLTVLDGVPGGLHRGTVRLHDKKP